MNLHMCSWAPAIAIPLCAARVDAAFSGYSSGWENPWNAQTVTLVDLRHLPPEMDLFACPASAPGEVPTPPAAIPTVEVLPATDERATAAVESGPLAFTGGADRRLLFLGGAAVFAGVILRGLGVKDTPRKPKESSIPPR